MEFCIQATILPELVYFDQPFQACFTRGDLSSCEELSLIRGGQGSTREDGA